MSKIFTRLYTGDTVASVGGKCFKQLVPDFRETWVWNNIPTNFPTVLIYDDTDEEIQKIYAKPFLVEGIEYYSNGIMYDAICYFRAIVYNFSGATDGTALDGIFYLGDKIESTGKYKKAEIAYAQDGVLTGWQKTAYKTVTYTSAIKDTDFLAFRKANATKSASSVLAVLDDEVTARNSRDNSVITALMSRLIEK